MKANEFREWFSYTTKRFPEMASWVNRQQQHEVKPEDIYLAWEKALGDAELSHAKDAVDEILAGRLEKPEYGWSSLPKIVRGYCSDLAARQRIDDVSGERQQNREKRKTDRWHNDGTTETCVQMFERLERERGGPPEWCARYGRGVKQA